MQKLLVIIALIFATLAIQTQTTAPIQSRPLWLQKVDEGVWQTAVSAPTATEFLVMLTAQADLSAAAALPDKDAKGRYVYEQLTAVARQTQPALTAQLNTLGVSYRPFWIANMVWVRGDKTVIETVAQRPDVAHIFPNPSVQFNRPETAVFPQLATDVTGVEWSLAHVGAADVWAMGITGAGVVVGGQDTGYDWDHPSLINQYRGWDGAIANHNYNWHDAIHENNPNTAVGNPCGFDAAVPCDDHSHGTHTMGTMAGNDLDAADPDWPGGAANAVGMAPGARWIGCRNMEEGYGTPATYAECYEWFVAPYPVGGDPMTDGDPAKAPHVINNSWGCPPLEGCTDPNVLLAVVGNVRAAGIVTVHSAGNYGSSSCSTVTDPAAIYDSSFTVGNTTSSDTISSSSSIGPVTVDGSNRLKPDITAPGSGIRSTIPNGSYATFSGTSMAGPHVAGLVALLISANPSLAGDVDAIEQIIRETAVPLTTTKTCGGDTPTSVPNHVFGYGRIDALAAITSMFPYHTFLPLVQSE